MTERYQFHYGHETVYARVVHLVAQHHLAAGEVLVDLGCGFGAIAEPVKELGLTYVGLDLDAEGVKDLAARGFETGLVDLGDLAGLRSTIESRLDGRPLAAITLIDTLEHLPQGTEVLRVLSETAAAHSSAPLIVSVPNVTHFDVGLKLLFGRWDVTEVGLLDETHVAFFSWERLERVTQTAGWSLIGEHDFELYESDQHFPGELVPLQRGTPVNLYLRDLREHAHGHANVNQFVRAFAPVASVHSAPTFVLPESVGSEVFLSVLVRTQARRMETLQEAMLSLAAQTSNAFEVLLLCHDVQPIDIGHVRYLVDSFDPEFSARVRIIPVAGGGRSRPLNVGIDEAHGEYVAVLDDDDLALANWVAVFEELAAKTPGRILRSMVGEQMVAEGRWGQRAGYHTESRPRCPYPERFDLYDHLLENHSPPCGYAIPLSCFKDFGVRFDESLPVLEDWDVLLQAVFICGIADSEVVTSLYRRWRVGASSTSVHSSEEWQYAHASVIGKLNLRPLVFEPGAITEIRRRGHAAERLKSDSVELERVRIELEHARMEIRDLRSSTSWKVAGAARMAGRVGRDLARRIR